MPKTDLVNYIENQKTKFITISDTIWDIAESGLQEFKSAKFITETFEKAGFKVERGVADMETAFTATYGSGSPVIAILGEYDALPGMSQKPVPRREPVKEDANGQACNHNLLGTAGIAACFALKEAIDKGDLKGTIRFYGCPAEEKYNAKGWMVVNGLFDDVDMGVTWHPGNVNAVNNYSTLAIDTIMFLFHGRAAHASRDPYNGRSALDAVELMNVGVNYMREHMIPDGRIHYTITHGGGAPNVVPAFAESYYYIRAPKRKQVDDLYKRVVKIAQGAALMTETEVEIDFLSATYNCRENSVITAELLKNMKEIGVPQWTKEDIDFATELRKSIPENGFDHFYGMLTKANQNYVDELIKKPICDVVVDDWGAGQVLTASTDVADVSWKVPLAQFSTATQIMGSPGHSWQNVAAGRMGIGQKGMLFAAKILATTVWDFMTNPDKIKAAKEEFNKENAKEPYVNPFPEGHKPPYHRLQKDKLQYD